VVCAQLQLNLRNAVSHVPEYVTTYHRQQAVVGAHNSKLDSPLRPGTGANPLNFGRSKTELEHQYGISSTESEVEHEEREERRISHAIELDMTAVQDP